MPVRTEKFSFPPEPGWKEKLVKFVVNYRIQLIAGAGALVLVLALLIWQPWRQRGVTPEPAPSSSTVSEPENSTTSTPESSESDSESSSENGNAPVDVDFESAASAENEGQLRTLLADDTVAAVRIDSEGPLFINEPIEVTKPLLVKGRLYLRAPLVMIGAQLRVEGPVYGSTMMRTMDGGGITVAGDGVIWADGLIWTENAGDLRYEDGAGEYQGRHITLDEEELFKDAQPVRSYAEFETACHTKKPIIIEKRFKVDQGALLSPQSDVLIEEGVEVTLGWNDTLEMRGHVLINRGTLAGRLHMVDSSSPSTLINYGTLDTAVNLSGEGAAVNLGQWNVRSADMNDPFTVINGKRGTLTLTEEPEADNSYILIDTSRMYNFGEISLGGLERRSYINLTGEGSFNGGSITIGDNASLANSGHLMNCGSITAKKGGELMNFAFIETSGENGLLDLADNTWQGEGVVTYGDHTQLRVSEDESGRHTDGRAAIAFGEAYYEDQRWVSNEQELRDALSDPEVARVRTTVPITVEGDLDVDKIFAPEDELTVNGTVRIRGNQGLLWSSNGQFKAESLVIEDRAMGIFFDSFSPGSVTIQSGGRMYTHGYGNEYAYDLRNSGGCAIYGGTQSFTGSSFTLEEGGLLRLTGKLELMGCGVSIGEDCQFVTDSGELVTDSGCTVANDGEVNIGGWGWKERVLCGQIENRGVMALGPKVALGDGSGGSFVNRGSLILQGDPNGPAVLRMGLENLGTVSDPGGGGIRIEDGGSATGVPEEFIK